MISNVFRKTKTIYHLLIVISITLLVSGIFTSLNIGLNQREIHILIIFAGIYFLISETIMFNYQRNFLKRIHAGIEFKKRFEVLILGFSITIGTLVLCGVGFLLTTNLWFLIIFFTGLVIYLLKFPTYKKVQKFFPQEKPGSEVSYSKNDKKNWILHIILGIMVSAPIAYFMISWSLTGDNGPGDLEELASGYIKHNTYINESLCWKFDIPEEFEVTHNKDLIQYNSELNSKLSTNQFTFTLFSLESDSSTVTASITKCPLNYTLNSYIHFLKNEMENAQISSSYPEFTSAYDIYFDEHLFKTLVFLVNNNGTGFRIATISSIYKDNIINITLIYTHIKENSASKLIKALINSEFGCY